MARLGLNPSEYCCYESEPRKPTYDGGIYATIKDLNKPTTILVVGLRGGGKRSLLANIAAEPSCLSLSLEALTIGDRMPVDRVDRVNINHASLVALDLGGEYAEAAEERRMRLREHLQTAVSVGVSGLLFVVDARDCQTLEAAREEMVAFSAMVAPLGVPLAVFFNHRAAGKSGQEDVDRDVIMEGYLEGYKKSDMQGYLDGYEESDMDVDMNVDDGRDMVELESLEMDWYVEPRLSLFQPFLGSQQPCSGSPLYAPPFRIRGLTLLFRVNLMWDRPVEAFIGSVTGREGYGEALRWLIQ